MSLPCLLHTHRTLQPESLLSYEGNVEEVTTSATTFLHHAPRPWRSSCRVSKNVIVRSSFTHHRSHYIRCSRKYGRSGNITEQYATHIIPNCTTCLWKRGGGDEHPSSSTQTILFHSQVTSRRNTKSRGNCNECYLAEHTADHCELLQP